MVYLADEHKKLTAMCSKQKQEITKLKNLLDDEVKIKNVEILKYKTTLAEIQRNSKSWQSQLNQMN